MNTTIESSLPYVAEIELMSPETKAFIYARDDELQRRRASDYAAGARVRGTRTADLEARIEQAIEAIAARLRKPHKCFWTSEIIEYFELKGLAVPDRDVIKRVVDNFDRNRLGF